MVLKTNIMFSIKELTATLIFLGSFEENSKWTNYPSECIFLSIYPGPNSSSTNIILHRDFAYFSVYKSYSSLKWWTLSTT